jgi:SAM-dependent methyltransferase
VVSHGALLREVRQYYDRKLADHGPTPAGVDWNSFESQQLRFLQLEGLWVGRPDASLIDYGCGYGALAAFIRSRGHRGSYVGFDLSDAMVEAARAHTADLADCTFTTQAADLAPADFAVASGIFNVRLAAGNEAWREYMRGALDDLSALGTHGFAFNALTSYSDPDRRRADLYYADPLDLFDECLRTYSRYVRLVHDYPLFEFTIIVRR